jgi:hypothetical protein
MYKLISSISLISVSNTIHGLSVLQSYYRKPEGKGPPVRSMPRWENNCGMDLKETGCDNVDWIHQVEDRVQ